MTFSNIFLSMKGKINRINYSWVVVTTLFGGVRKKQRNNFFRIFCVAKFDDSLFKKQSVSCIFYSFCHQQQLQISTANLILPTDQNTCLLSRYRVIHSRERTSFELPPSIKFEIAVCRCICICVPVVKIALFP